MQLEFRYLLQYRPSKTQNGQNDFFCSCEELFAVPILLFSVSMAVNGQHVVYIGNRGIEDISRTRKPASESLILPRTKPRLDAIGGAHTCSPPYLVYVMEFFKRKHFL